ncbi:RICIN domain-containing protein [Kineococcus sp. SYSU DK002]|uniref:RICIN domain-containing protein n=1 Tax=Kineococcus sp. SYSU DK002 TaxID=3383123 RepID=UPI003D7CA55E
MSRSPLTAIAGVLSGAALVLTVAAAPASAAGLDGVFAIKNKTTGKCADLPGFGAGTQGGPVNQFTCRYPSGDNQAWRFVPKGTATGGSGTKYNRYLIRNTADGRCLDAPGTGDNANGAKIVEYSCNPDPSKDNQLWYTVPKDVTYPDGTRRTGVWIVNEKSRKCLDVSGYRAGNDARLTLFSCTTSQKDDHLWAITSRP